MMYCMILLPCWCEPIVKTWKGKGDFIEATDNMSNREDYVIIDNVEMKNKIVAIYKQRYMEE